MSNPADDSTSSAPADPSQVTAPQEDTSITLYKWVTLENFPLLLPSVFGAIGGLLSIIWFGLFVAGMILSASIMWFGLARALAKQSEDAEAGESTPLQIFHDKISYKLLRLSMPWYHAELVEAQLHQVEDIDEAGTVETTDERFVGAVRFNGVNTADMNEEQRNTMVADLSTAIDESVKNFKFRYYSTKSAFDPERIVGQYDEAARSERLHRRGMEFVQEMFFSVYEWFKTDDEATWEADEWRHYVIVEVTAQEVRERYEGIGAETETDAAGIDSATRRDMQDLLDERLETVRHEMAGSIEKCEATYVGPAEMTALLHRYWSGKTRLGTLRDAEEKDDEGDTETPHVETGTEDGGVSWTPTEQLVEGTTYEDLGLDDDQEESEERANRAVRALREIVRTLRGEDDDQEAGTIGGRSYSDSLAASHFDAQKGQIEIGQQYARTYHIAAWSPKPTSMFLRKLYNLREGVDVDVCIHNQDLDREEVKEALRYDIRDLNVEEEERGKDISALDISEAKKSHIRLYGQLRAEVTQPWAINGYVTVRAGDRETIDELEADLENADQFDVFKRRELEDATEEVRKAAEGTPANLTLIKPERRQKEAFVAGSPVGSDRYNEVSVGLDWMRGVRAYFNAETTGDVMPGRRTTLAGGGTVGAMFPFCSAVVQDPEGTLWGRNMQNGSPINIDPLARGSSGHTLTIGKTRHGKTYAATLINGRWFNEKEDRTLIGADTQGGLNGLTEVCDGEVQVIDGSSPLNILSVSPPDESYTVGTGDSDPLRMKIDEVSMALTTVLDRQGVENPGEYVSQIEDITTRTYAEAGIKKDDVESLKNPSPNMENWLDKATEMIHDAEDYTHSGHEAETSIKTQRIAELLDYLSGFRPGGKYDSLLGDPDGEGEEMVDTMGLGLDDPEVDMVYLDLQQTSVDKSVMLPLVLGQVSQAIRKAPGESCFLADEAHVLLHNERAVDWITRAAREYARYEAFLWLISQHPSEFLASGSSDDKEVFKDQCSIIQFFRTPGVDLDTLKRFDMNEQQASRVRKSLVTGRSEKGYSECLISLQDHNGWIPMRVEACDFEDILLNYKPSKHGEFHRYVAEETGKEKFEKLADEIDEATEIEQKEARIAELEDALREARETPPAETEPEPATAATDGGEVDDVQEESDDDRAGEDRERDRPDPETPSQCGECGKFLADAHKLDVCDSCLGRH